MNRTRDYYRKQRAKHIARKKRMIKEWSRGGIGLYWAAPAGALSKGKIHCSCRICRCKSYDYKKAKDLARIEAMNESEKYYFNDEDYLGELYDDELFKDDAAYRWDFTESSWYYEDGFYHDWLIDHPNGSTD